MMIKQFDGLLERLGGKQARRAHSFALDANLYAALMDQAGREQVPAQDLYRYLLESGLAKRQKSEELGQRWETLSRREQDVIAFVCLRYTNRQIAAAMQISNLTVNWYVRKILEKFNFHSKLEIQMKFSNWDFNNWGPKSQG